jgi:hypothetical protein
MLVIFGWQLKGNLKNTLIDAPEGHNVGRFLTGVEHLQPYIQLLSMIANGQWRHKNLRHCVATR